ncbi:hypothetical protein D3C72_255730 [compost metagenome]
MTDFFAPELGTSSMTSIARIFLESRWLAEDFGAIALIPTLDDGLRTAAATLLDRLILGAVRLQTLTDGAAFSGWDGQVRLEQTAPDLIVARVAEMAEVRLPLILEGPQEPVATGAFPWGSTAIYAGTIELQEGSLRGIIKAVVDHSAPIAFVCLLLAYPVEQGFRLHFQNAEIQRRVSNQPCVTIHDVSISLWALKKQSADAININSLDRSAADYTTRVCMLQALLRADDEVNPGPVDGDLGPQTMEALKTFAARRGWKVDDDRVYVQLIDNIHRLPN